MKTTYFFCIATILLLPFLLQAQVVNQSQVVSVSGGTSTSGNYSNFAVVGEPFVANHTSVGNYVSNDGFIYRISDATLLNLTVYLEGLFNGYGMNKAQNASGDQFSGLVADQINIELHSSQNYSTIAYAASNINISTTGQASINIPADNSGLYYLAVKHRNSLETISAQPITISGGTKSYDFTLAATQAFGNNLKLLSSGLYGIFTGDVNADGIINNSDIAAIRTSASIFQSGYLAVDLNGDGKVDALDLILADNNAAGFFKVLKP